MSVTALEADLRRVVRGEVRFDTMSRWLYSTDASSYQQVPLGVVVPQDVADLQAALRQIAAHGASVVPRGGGTSLSGQTIGPGVVIDLSRHLDAVIAIDADARIARVQAGCVLDRLNRALRPHGLMVGPDPSSSMAATIGGMTGNNSTGSHSIRYGLMIDHVQAVSVVLADGTLAHFGPKTADEVAALQAQDTLEGRLYREIPALLARYEAAIRERTPGTWRTVAGYNLARLLDAPAGTLNLAPLIVGSEGTLGVITEVTLSVVPRPPMTRLLVLHFETLHDALSRVPGLLTLQPAAVELIDRTFNQLTRRSPEYGHDLDFIVGDPRAALVVELAGDDDAELSAAAAKLHAHLAATGYSGAIVARTTPAAIRRVWAVRKAGLGLLLSQRGDAKPLAFVDDAAVPVQHLADYADDVEAICAEHGTEAAFYAHASAGCLHINPLINLKTEAGLAAMRAISQAVAARAIHYGGTTTGEHGEGYARSYYNRQLFGETVHQAFREVKALFDPAGLFNPGKVIDGPEPWRPDLLRFQPGYATPLAPAQTTLDFSTDGGFGGLVEMCNGQGACRSDNADGGVMCPTFVATRDEAHSTRGRANALRAAITGGLGPLGLNDPALYDVLDLCLECKACQRECPSLVDMAKLKYEFLAQVQAVRGVPLRSRVFANIAALSALGRRVSPRLTNAAYNSRPLRRIMDAALGIDARRSLPPLARQSFRAWWRARGHVERPGHMPRTGREVVLWDDTYVQHNQPEIGQAAVALLEAAGFRVRLLTDRRCCGRPMISKGLLDQARANAAYNVARLLPFAERGVPILGLEPSCLTTFRDEYPDLLRTPESRLVAQQSLFFEQFIAQEAAAGRLTLPLRPADSATIHVHGHCYQKAQTGTGPLLAMLRLIPGADVREIPSGCCGMAGAFGYEREHYDLSLAVGEDRLFPAVRAAAPHEPVLASGMSCRHQIHDGTGREPLHPVVFLAAHLIPQTTERTP